MTSRSAPPTTAMAMPGSTRTPPAWAAAWAAASPMLSAISLARSSARVGARGGGPQVYRGADLKYALEITLEQAASGFDTEIRVPSWENCDTCHGSGAKGRHLAQDLPDLRRFGRGAHAAGLFQRPADLPDLPRHRQEITDPCPSCDGVGRTRRNKTLQVKIPAGIDDGMRIRSSGNGEPGINGGPPGDLYVEIHIKQHKIFQRDGDDLHCELTIRSPRRRWAASCRCRPWAAPPCAAEVVHNSRHCRYHIEHYGAIRPYREALRHSIAYPPRMKFVHPESAARRASLQPVLRSARRGAKPRSRILHAPPGSRMPLHQRVGSPPAALRQAISERNRHRTPSRYLWCSDQRRFCRLKPSRPRTHRRRHRITRYASTGGASVRSATMSPTSGPPQLIPQLLRSKTRTLCSVAASA